VKASVAEAAFAESENEASYVQPEQIRPRFSQTDEPGVSPRENEPVVSVDKSRRCGCVIGTPFGSRSRAARVEPQSVLADRAIKTAFHGAACKMRADPS